MAENKKVYEEKVPARVKWTISIADASCGLLGTVIYGGAMTYYYTQCLGLDSKLVSLAWTVFAVWNAVNDPLFGFISDRTKSKLGRRIPYIRYGGIIYGICYALCFSNIDTDNQWVLFAQMLVLLFLFDTFYTAVASALYVMPYEVAITNQARGSIILIKSILYFFPLAFSMVIVPMIQPGVGEDETVYQIINAFIGLGAGAIIFLCTFFFKERARIQESPDMPFIKSIVECFKNVQFLLYEVLSFTVILVQGCLLLGLYYYLDEFDINQIFLYGGAAVGAILGLVLTPVSIKKFGVRKVLLVLCAAMSLASVVMLFGGGSTATATVFFFLTGLSFIGMMLGVPLINGDVIDYDELRVGQRREGMYAGVNSLITKPAQSLAQSAFLLLAVRFGYVEGLTKGLQSAQGEKAILAAWMIIPAVSLFICVIALIFYKLDGKEWNNKKHALSQKHLEAENERVVQEMPE